MNLSPISRFTSRHALKIKKNSPQILFYGGIAGTIATTILASRATLKAVPTVEKLKQDRANLEEFAATNDVSKEDFTKIVAAQYTTAGVQLTKVYAPVVIVGGVSIMALTKSHQQLTSRNNALTVAFTGLYETFNRYRGRVRDQLGDDIDQQFLHGVVEKEVEITDKNGNVKTKTITTLDPDSKAALTHYFDQNTPSWSSHSGYNQAMLDGQQDWANILLQRQGFLFLNEVYELLQIPKTREGNILGWVFKDLGNNDTFVNFGHDKDGEFVGGFKRDVLLEFNIHGSILDLI
jgi:hypothetical protein